MTIPTAPTDCLRAAPQPATRIPALAVGLAWLVLGLVAVLIATLAPPKASLTAGGAGFRPALAVMALTPPSPAPLVQRLDRDGSAITAADIDLPADPALPSPPVGSMPTQGAIATSFRLTSTAVPAQAALASPLRPPRRV